MGYNQDGDADRTLAAGFAPASLPAQGSKIDLRDSVALPGPVTTVGDAAMAGSSLSHPDRLEPGYHHMADPTWSLTSASAASASVPARLGWYSWDVTAALQAWSDNRDTSKFSLLLQSDVTSGQHDRRFWSKDCSPADCGSNVRS